MDLGLKDQVALVTGAGSPRGFGKGIALALAAEGCHVIVMDINEEWARQTAGEIEDMGRQSMAVQADISNSAEVNAAVKAALAKFGKIDILINNAGRTAPPKMFVDKPEEEWDQDINIILRGPLIVTKAVLPQMIQRKFGHIVNICSGVGTFGMARGSIYAAAKGAVASFTRSLAKEVIKDGIWVNGVAPGLGDTNFLRSSQILKTQETPPEFLKAVTARIPLGRVTRPEDIGAVATFLCSAVASDIVGQIIDVDGGQIISQG